MEVVTDICETDVLAAGMAYIRRAQRARAKNLVNIVPGVGNNKIILLAAPLYTPSHPRHVLKITVVG